MEVGCCTTLSIYMSVKFPHLLIYLLTYLLTYIKVLLCFYYRFMLIFCVLDLPFYNIHQGQL